VAGNKGKGAFGGKGVAGGRGGGGGGGGARKWVEGRRLWALSGRPTNPVSSRGRKMDPPIPPRGGRRFENQTFSFPIRAPKTKTITFSAPCYLTEQKGAFGAFVSGCFGVVFFPGGRPHLVSFASLKGPGGLCTIGPFWPFFCCQQERTPRGGEKNFVLGGTFVLVSVFL